MSPSLNAAEEAVCAAKTPPTHKKPDNPAATTEILISILLCPK
jgi:hypothetical protein